MRVIELSLKRRVTVAMVAIAVSLFGAVAFTRLPVNLLPDISYPSLTIETRFPGAAPSEVESLVTRPIEEAVGIVAGVQRLESVSRPGLSQVTLEFGWKRDMDFASLDVRQKLDLVTLPRQAVKPVLQRFDPENDPILRLYLTGSDDLFLLRYVGEEILKKDLESTAGLAAVKVQGGYEEEILVQVDEGKLSLLGLNIAQVREKLAQENINQAGGSLYEQEARYLVRSRNEFEDLDDILETTVFSEGARLVTLGDVAIVERTHKKREVVSRFGGEEAVELALYKEGDANTVSVAQAIEQRLEKVRKELPEGIEVAIGTDQSRFIRASIREVLSNAVIGGAIAIVILLLFLKDLRSTLVIGVSIPLSVVATFFLMYRTGTSLNIMSLGGLALGVGMLVDNAIVVLESIHKRRERGSDPDEAASEGASEVGTAVVASTLTTVAVFLPVVFLEGIAAQLFRDQALTVSFSLMASLAVSLTLIPMLAAVLAGGGTSAPVASGPIEGAGKVRRGAHAVLVAGPKWILFGLRWVIGGLGRVLALLARPFGKVFDLILGSVAAAYPRILRGALRARLVVVALAGLALWAAVAAIPGLGLDLIPSISQGEFSFRIELAEGTPLEITDRLVSDVQAVLLDDERVHSFASISGGAGLAFASTGTEGENVGRIQVRMAEGTRSEDEEAVVAALRDRLQRAEGASYELERPAVFTLRTPVEIELYGQNLVELHEAARVLEDRMRDVDGLVDLRSTAELGNPELQITFHREQLVKLGLDLAQVAETVRNKIQGEVATRFTEEDREIDIRVRSIGRSAASVEEVADLIVGQRSVGGTRTFTERTESGILIDREVAIGSAQSVPIRLKTVADVRVEEGPSEIRRIGQRRAALLTANLENRDMGAVASDLGAILSDLALPPGVVAIVGGQQEEMARSLRSMLMAMGLAIFLVYLVMASQFESFLHPFVIIFTLPLGAIGVIGALALTGQTLNVVALIGAVMLAGIVVNNGIVLIDAVNRLRSEGLARRDALVAAGKERLRPILMTSATTIFGLLPMALGLGEGAELRAPLAITVIGGLSVATVLTLVVIPVVYSLLDRKVLEGDLEPVAEAARVEEGKLPPGTENEPPRSAGPGAQLAGSA